MMTEIYPKRASKDMMGVKKRLDLGPFLIQLSDSLQIFSGVFKGELKWYWKKSYRDWKSVFIIIDLGVFSLTFGCSQLQIRIVKHCHRFLAAAKVKAKMNHGRFEDI